MVRYKNYVSSSYGGTKLITQQLDVPYFSHVTALLHSVSALTVPTSPHTIRKNILRWLVRSYTDSNKISQSPWISVLLHTGEVPCLNLGSGAAVLNFIMDYISQMLGIAWNSEPITCFHVIPSTIFTEIKLRGFSPQANYTDQATAACRRS
jgi:hypothetical protein